MNPGEIGCPDYARVVDELRNHEVGLGVVAASRYVSTERLTDRVEQKVTGIRDSPAENEALRVEHRAQGGACLP